MVWFQRYSDRERIWKNKQRLKGTNFYIAEDFPIIEEQQRKQPSPDTKTAKQLPERNKKVTMRGDKLLLDGKVFTCNDTERGPTSNQPVKLDERSNNDVIVFGGSTSSHYGLSNFYEGRFVYDHIAYNTAEQAYQHKKARPPTKHDVKDIIKTFEDYLQVLQTKTSRHQNVNNLEIIYCLRFA